MNTTTTHSQNMIRRDASPFLRWCACATAVLFFGIGVLAIYLMYESYSEAKASESWPQTPGKVGHLQVEWKQVGSKPKEYHAEITYQYQVKGKSYSGTRIRNSSVYSTDYEVATEGVKDLQVNSLTSVFYNPDDPAKSVLVPGVGPDAYMYVAVPGIFFAISAGLFALFAYWRRNAAQPAVAKARPGLFLK